MQAGRALGSRYQLVERLGHGAMGEVWRTIDRVTSGEVAAKLLRGEYARDPQIVARFVQERAILLALQHPNIVEVRDLVVEGDDLAIVMELVSGSDLREHLRARGTLRPREAVEITIAVLNALAHAHAANVLHRDVKPDNVLLADGGQPKLTDFGIARLTQETTVRPTAALGTPEYMAPETFEANQVSAAADVYGAGIQLYELLAGRTPFAGGANGYTVANRHVTAVPPTIPGLPPRLATVLDRMLAKEPAKRLSAHGAAQALAAVLPDLDGSPALPPLPQPEAWAPAAGAVPVPAADGIDPGATSLRGVARGEPSPGPVAAPDQRVFAVSPLAPSAVPDATTLGVVRPEHHAPILEPAVTPSQSSATRRGRLLAIAGAVTAVVAAGILIAGLTSGGPGGTSARPPVPAVPVRAAQSDVELPTGLRVSREAVLDPAAKTLTMMVTWEAAHTPIRGPFFEAVPDARCRVTWEGPRPQDDRNDGVSAPCGFEVEVGTLRAQQQFSRSYTVPFDPRDSDPSAAVKKFLDDAAAETARALRGIPQSSVYPVQRLHAVHVQVPATVHTGHLVGVTLWPVWIGEEAPDTTNPLFDTVDTTSAPPLMLRQIAGGLANLELSVRGCSGAIIVDRLRYPTADEQAHDCVIHARVGEIDADSEPFQITYR